jgi:hypothetical protein
MEAPLRTLHESPGGFQPVLNCRWSALSLFLAYSSGLLFAFTGIPAILCGLVAFVALYRSRGALTGWPSALFGVAGGVFFTWLHADGMALYAALHDHLLDVLELRSILLSPNP